MRKAPLIASLSLFACLPLTAQPAATELNPPAPAAPTTTNLSAADEQAIRNEMATVVEDATLPQRFDQLVNQFSWPDRARATAPEANKTPLPPAAVASHEKLDLAVADLQKSWKAKYRQDFNLRGNESKVFNTTFARIDVGDFGDAARTAGERVPPAGAGPTTRPSAKPTGVNTTPPPNPAAAPAQVPGRKTENAPTAHTPTIAAASQPAGLSQANNRALATIPQGHDAAALVLRFVQEGGAWKIEAPGQVDRQLLQDALARHLDMATHEIASKAPADPNEAYRAVSHHVFLAIQEATLMKSGTDTGTRASAE